MTEAARARLTALLRRIIIAEGGTIVGELDNGAVYVVRLPELNEPIHLRVDEQISLLSKQPEPYNGY